MTSFRKPPLGTGGAPLLFWLAVVSGLCATTYVHIEEPHHYMPLWFGAVVGVGIGQLVALVRLRIWPLVVLALGFGCFAGPVLAVAVTVLFGSGHASEAAFYALAPALVCGYASLTTGGALLAFWYPAMLWMLVILDGNTPGTFTSSTPLLVALAGLFVAYLHARETRRAALWKSYATENLAMASTPTVLRASPTRGVAQYGWTAFAGAGALLLAWWVAPNLWERERVQHRQVLAASQTYGSFTNYGDYDHETGLPCCPADINAERVSEYMPIPGVVATANQASSCTQCKPPPTPSEIAYGWTYQGTPGAGLWGSVRYGHGYGTYGGRCYGAGCGSAGYGNGTYGTGVAYGGGTYGGGTYGGAYDGYGSDDVIPTADPLAAGTPTPTPTPAATVDVPAIDPTPSATTTAPVTPVGTPSPTTPGPSAVTPSTPSLPALPSLGSVLALAGLAVGVHLVLRAFRRSLTLRHLATPFWAEPIDQQISNHWQRALIGLRDAGIHTRDAEQPHVLARRVGIASMATCAAILERVRHGVRVDVDDLGAMSAAADDVYRTSRARAGTVGRIASTFRWPLA